MHRRFYLAKAQRKIGELLPQVRFGRRTGRALLPNATDRRLRGALHNLSHTQPGIALHCRAHAPKLCKSLAKTVILHAALLLPRNGTSRSVECFHNAITGQGGCENEYGLK